MFYSQGWEESKVPALSQRELAKCFARGEGRDAGMQSGVFALLKRRPGLQS